MGFTSQKRWANPQQPALNDGSNCVWVALLWDLRVEGAVAIAASQVACFVLLCYGPDIMVGNAPRLVHMNQSRVIFCDDGAL